MARSIKKGPYIEEKLLAKIRKMEAEGTKNVIKTWSRRSTITPELIGYTFAVHNGKNSSRFMSRRIWWGINSESLHRPGFSFLIPVIGKPKSASIFGR